MATDDITFICSPYGGGLRYMNEDYAKRALKDSLDRGEVPFASHLLYTQVLEDDVPEQRRQGMGCERIFIDIALNYIAYVGNEGHVVLAVYYDHGISPGMRDTISYMFHHELSRCAMIQWRTLETAKAEAKPPPIPEITLKLVETSPEPAA